MRDRVSVARCKNCGAINPPRFPEGVCMQGDGPLRHETESVLYEPVSNREALAAELERRAASVSKAGVAHGLTEAAQLVRDFDTEEGK